MANYENQAFLDDYTLKIAEGQILKGEFKEAEITLNRVIEKKQKKSNIDNSTDRSLVEMAGLSSVNYFEAYLPLPQLFLGKYKEAEKGFGKYYAIEAYDKKFPRFADYYLYIFKTLEKNELVPKQHVYQMEHTRFMLEFSRN